MKDNNITWKNISPADISSTFCAKYFAFSKGKKVFLVSDVSGGCLFTKIIQASAGMNCSIYDMDIWVGYAGGMLDEIHTSGNLSTPNALIEWDAGKQTHAVPMTA